MKFCLIGKGFEEVIMSDGSKAVGVEHKGEFVILNKQLQEFKDRVVEEVKKETE